MTSLAKHTVQQLDALELTRDRPLLISDADEVLLQFAGPLESFLQTQDMFIDFSSYKIFGNVRSRADQQPVPKEEVFNLLGTFFAEHVHTCPPVDGAVEALRHLSEDFQIVILTNTPPFAREARANSLAAQGLNYPVITNEGHKGPAVRFLAERTSGPVVFIDDIPHHHQSIADEAPEVHRIHFVADPRLARLLPQAEHSHIRLDCWQQTRDHILSLLD